MEKYQAFLMVCPLAGFSDPNSPPSRRESRVLAEEPRELVDVIVAHRARDRGDRLAAIGEQHARSTHNCSLMTYSMGASPK